MSRCAASVTPKPRMRSFSVRVLGCKVNQHEARQIEALLEAAGLAPAEPGAEPDLCVVHGCAVTRTALAKTVRQVRALAGQAGRVMVTGCGNAPEAAGAYPDEVVCVPSGPGWIEAFCAVLESFSPPKPIPRAARREEGPVLTRFDRHTRAFLKIQDGCDLGCAYCIVPSLRGAPRDRPMKAIRQEARNLARNGHAEIVVTGVSVGLFGREGPASLTDALRAVAGTPGVKRVRLSSLHPAELTDDLLSFWATCSRMAPHIHLPLQSGSDAVLARMRRGYTTADFRAAAARARRMPAEPSFSTDVIVGFPGETDEDFEQTLALCRELGFVRIHVFPFSPRPGTDAARMRPRTDGATVRARAARLRALATDLAARAHRAAVGGRPALVLCEQRDPATGLWRGYSGHYLPVRFPGPPQWGGRLIRVVPEGADDHGAWARSRPA